MNLADQSLFLSHPDPMWIYDLETLHFLAVNEAAMSKYGYSRTEFLALTIADIRPDEDRAALNRNVASVTVGRDDAGIWRHCLKSGEVIHVDITGHTLEYEGRRAELISARDVSHLVLAERTAREALAREEVARRSSDALSRQFQAMFASIPGLYVVFAPDNFGVIAISDAYLGLMGLVRADALGRSLFDILPHQPQDPGHDILRSSLKRVIATGKADLPDFQRFRLPLNRASQAAADRLWAISNVPVRGPDGRVIHIMLRMQDVTGVIDPGASGRAKLNQVRFDLLESTLELKAENLRLTELATRLRTAERLLHIGSWDYVADEDRLIWSRHVYDIYGVTPETFGHRLEDYVALVHSDDRSMMQADFAAFAASDESIFSFAHQIQRPDDRIVHVHGVAEWVETANGRILTGVVQDVSETVESAHSLARAKRMLEIAGKAARFGAWQFDLESERLEWSPETARIHGEPEDFTPSVAKGISYYVPEHRERIARLFRACVEDGVPYDELLEIITSGGRRIWVRSIGEPERDRNGRIVAVRGSFQDISELVSARQEAKELGTRLAETLEHIGDAFVMLDGDGRFTYLNSRAALLLGRSRDDLTGRSIDAEFPELIGRRFASEYKRAFEQKETIRFERDYPPLGRAFRIHAHPTPNGLAVYFSDITQERQRQEQLRLLDAAISHLNDMVIISQPGPEHARIVYVNDAFERHTGYPRSDVMGRSPDILRGPGTDRADLDRIHSAIENGRGVRAELLCYSKSGEELWLDLEIVPLADDTGYCTHWVWVMRDITERKRDEEVLRLSEERFRMFARATNDVIWDWDIAGGTVWWNETLETVFGHTSHGRHLASTSWRHLIHPDDRERVTKGLEMIVSGAGGYWTDEYRFSNSEGSFRQVVDRGLVLRDPQGRAIRMIGSIVDVTDQRELENQLRQTLKLEALGKLTGGVAHDFNNLLTIILGNAELLADRLTADSGLHLLAEVIEGAAMRGAELTSRLLAFARQQPLQPRPVSVNRVILGMENLLRRTLSVAIDMEIRADEALWIAAIDPNQLETALLNLVINARDAMPEGGKLVIRTANATLVSDQATHRLELAPGDYVTVSVSDSGEGMAPDVIECAFDPFFTTKAAGKGSGLGLSMVYGFLKQSRGHAVIHSEEGRGTTVVLYFPKSTAQAELIRPDIDEVQNPGGTEHVLVVEDDALVRDHVLGLLHGLGYRTTGAQNAAEALEILERAPDIDLLFTDVVMPHGMGGGELAERAAELRPDLPVLFTTGYTANPNVLSGSLQGKWALLEKPYRRHQLAMAIRRVLGTGSD